MYESPHRIADTLRGLLAASCSSSPQAISSGTDVAEGREGGEEEEEDDDDDEGRSGSGGSNGAGAGESAASTTEAEFAAGQR